MSALHVGATLPTSQTKPLNLPGSWSVWAQAGDCPGGYFLTPYDDTARATGLKYVVIKAVLRKTAVEPELSIVRTDPHKPDLLPQPTKKGARR